MTQNQINREVAKATGETIERIRQIGFNVVIVPRYYRKPRPGGNQSEIATSPKRTQSKAQQPCAAA